MVQENQQDERVHYQDITSQHWSYSSEHYAGGDNLLTAIARGWEIDEVVKLRPSLVRGHALHRDLPLHHPPR